MPRLSRTELLLFLACLFTFAYFNQGGGWNQNARFAEVRAMAEEGRFAIDNFMVYRRDPATDDLRRVPVNNTGYELDGKRYRLAWVDMDYSLQPVSNQPAEPGVEDAPMIEVCSSGDVAYVPSTGHFHPNKPPGTSFLALPGYWLIWHAERALDINPDHWWTLTVNAWLTTVLSVGLISAIGCVLFFRLARELAGGDERAALLATFALAFGTTFLPFGTILFDHNLTASLLIASFYFLRCFNSGRGDFLAGLCAGLAAITNYVAAIAVVFLGLYLLLARRRQLRPCLLYSLGVAGPFLLICWYGWTCFGSPFRLNNDFQNPLFKDPSGALGMFAMPNLYVGGLLVASPFRGLFVLAPVLVLGLAGLAVWLKERTYAAEARLALAVFGFFFLVNMSFNGYHGGYSAGPRYLVPGIPFLALALVVAFRRWPRLSLVLLAVSAFQQVIMTATDAQNPLAVGGHTRLDEKHRRDDFFSSLVGDYAWPLFAKGRAEDLLNQLLQARLEEEADRLALTVDDEATRNARLAETEKEWRASMDRREPSPFMLAAIRGPVSVNPVGVYDGLLGYGCFAMDAPQSAWASCNAGELLMPGRRASLLPLLLVGGGLVFLAFRSARRSPLA